MKVEVEYLAQDSAVVKIIDRVDGRLSWTFSVTAPRPASSHPIQREAITLTRAHGHDTRMVNVSLL